MQKLNITTAMRPWRHAFMASAMGEFWMILLSFPTELPQAVSSTPVLTLQQEVVLV